MAGFGGGLARRLPLPVASQLRRFRSGIEAIGLEVIGLIPSHHARCILLRFFGMAIPPDAQLYRWREIRRPQGIRIGRGATVGRHAILNGRYGTTIGRGVISRAKFRSARPSMTP